MNLGDYYNGSSPTEESAVSKLNKALWTTGAEAQGGEINPPEPASVTGNLGERIIALGKGIQEVTQLISSSRISQDPYGDNLGKMMERYQPKGEPPLQKVHGIPQEIIDRNGGNAKEIKFGVQTLAKDSAKADEQLKQLKEWAAAAKDQLGDIQVYRITEKSGQQVAMVVGMDEHFSARAFNAVVGAVRHKEHMEKELTAAREEMLGVGQKKSEQEKTGQETGQASPINADKMAELAQKYPSKAPEQSESHVAEVKAPAYTPAKEKESGVMQVA